MKKLVAVIFALLMLGTTALGLAENVEISLNLSTATDEELAEAAALIKAEQKARLKTTIGTRARRKKRRENFRLHT